MVAKNSGITAKPKGRPRGRPFKKGQTGNPNGAPRKGSSLVEHLSAALEEVDSETGKTQAQLIAERYVSDAAKGSIAATENIIARFHGRPEQGIKLSGDEERPLHVRHSERGKA